MLSLHDISRRYKTDKAQHAHYLNNYEKYFGALRNEPIKLLELGIFDGGSLLMWRDYFPNGNIIGLDINPVTVDDATGRIRTYMGGQQDKVLLDKIAAENAPGGFDIIIDDCSHIASLSRVSFSHLFHNHLKSGGLYVIEDWGAGYWDDWPDGSAYKHREFNGTPSIRERISYRIASILRRSPTGVASGPLKLAKRIAASGLSSSHNAGMVGFVKELLDECGLSDINHPEHGAGQNRESSIKELHFSVSHVFVEKK